MTTAERRAEYNKKYYAENKLKLIETAKTYQNKLKAAKYSEMIESNEEKFQFEILKKQCENLKLRGEL